MYTWYRFWAILDKIIFKMHIHKINIFKAFFFMLSVFILNTSVKAQDDKAVAIKSAIESRSYIFKPQFVTPLGGRSRIVTSEYDMWVSKDSVKTYLPYFGRAYTAPIGGSGGGIMITSTEFDYSIKENKNGGWNILIKPKDTKDVRQLFLNVGHEGNASLHVTSNNRQAITFSGYVAARNIN